jgi:hypothetical protein
MTIAQIAHKPSVEERALDLFRRRGREIREIGTDLFEVPSSSGSATYQVDYEAETCTCPSYQYHPRHSCKHLLAVGVFYAKAHRKVSAQGHPHTCLDGYVFLGYIVLDQESGEEVESVESLPCRRCALEA